MSSSTPHPAPSDARGWLTDRRILGRWKPSVRTTIAQILDDSRTTLGVSRSTLDHQRSTALLDINELAQSDGLVPSALHSEVDTRLREILCERYEVTTTLQHGTILHIRLHEKDVKK